MYPIIISLKGVKFMSFSNGERSLLLIYRYMYMHKLLINIAQHILL